MNSSMEARVPSGWKHGTSTPPGSYTAALMRYCARSINPKIMESSWRMSEARMLSKESLSDLSVCWSLVEDDAVAAEQTDDDARR